MGAPEAVWVDLKIKSGLANTVEDIDRNIESALAREFVLPLQAISLQTGLGAVSIVGSGPSLKKNWKRLRDFKGDIIACNAACQFLLEKGIVPKYMFCFDADPLMLEFITPHKDITYLMASRCPPEAFDMLEGQRVVCWHAGGDEHIEELLQKHNRMEPMVSGGTAAITRCLLLAAYLGYRELHLWGADSSFADGDTHIRQSTTLERSIAVRVGARDFICAPWMARQVEDFKVLAPPLRDNYRLEIVVHGTGIIPHVARILGFRTDEQRWKHVAKVVKFKALTVWNNL